MALQDTIPDFGLYGDQNPFPDMFHAEAFSARAPVHDWTIAPHRHARMSQLFVIDDGHVEAAADDLNTVLSQGDFLYIPVHCVHRFDFRPGTEGMVLSFPLSLLDAVGPNPAELLGNLAKPFAGRMTPRLAATANLLRDAAADTVAFRLQITVPLAHSVLAQLAQARLSATQGAVAPGSARLSALDALINTHLEAGWTASDYAAAMSISTGHLSRLCRDVAGVGAAAYIERRIMNEACRMLAFTQLPVAEIGYRLGFPDPSYFSKRFRKAQALSPTDYRAQFT